MAEQIADTVRVISFRLACLREYEGYQLRPGERVISVEYSGEASRFYAVVMVEHSDGPDAGRMNA